MLEDARRGRASVMPCSNMQLFANPDLAYCEINGVLVFLDIACDRYFCLTKSRNSEALAYLDEQKMGRNRHPAFASEANSIQLPAASSPAIEAGPFRIADIARAMWVQRRVEKRIASRPFHSVISDLAAILDIRSCERCGSERDPVRMIRAFEYARLLRTAADRCLPRSIALGLCLASDGVRANVVIGVKLAPFGAHCWAQQGTDVLNDSVEEVLRYRPILVI